MTKLVKILEEYRYTLHLPDQDSSKLEAASKALKAKGCTVFAPPVRHYDIVSDLEALTLIGYIVEAVSET